MFGKIWFVSAVATFAAVATTTAVEPAAPASNARIGEGRVASQPGGPTAQDEYWLGIECFPVAPALRSHLNLAEKHGLLVLAVIPDGPAARAGIAKYDVLLRIGDRTLGGPRDLIEAIAASRGGTLKIELIRGGKPRTIEATPGKRPLMARAQVAVSPNSEDWDIVQKWLSGLRSEDLRLGAVGPGVLVPKGAAVRAPLPANMSIVVSKSGNQPAKISVQRNNDKWELTEKDLGVLPADIRPHVERMLHPEASGAFGGLEAMEIPSARVFRAPGQDARLGATSVSPSGSLEELIQRRMDAMDRRMEQLFRAVEALHAEHAGSNTPAVEKK